MVIPTMRHASVLVTLTSLLFFVGCFSSGESFPTVDLDGASIAGKVLEKYDSDGNGELSKAECDANGGLKMMLNADQYHPEVMLDADSSKSVSLQELADKFDGCFKHKRGTFNCKVKYKGKPLPGATVTIVPEEFMGPIGSASGETNEEGECGVTNEDGFIGGKPGIYRVEITHPTKKIKSKYNTETVLAIAIDTTNPYGKASEFKVQ